MYKVALGLVVAVFLAAVLGYVMNAGPDLSVDSASIDVGAAPSGSFREAAVTVTNHSSEPVRLLGAKTSCSCMLADQLPLTIPPKSSQTIDVGVSYNGTPQQDFSHSVLFYSSSERSPRVSVEIHGRTE